MAYLNVSPLSNSTVFKLVKPPYDQPQIAILLSSICWLFLCMNFFVTSVMSLGSQYPNFSRAHDLKLQPLPPVPLGSICRTITSNPETTACSNARDDLVVNV